MSRALLMVALFVLVTFAGCRALLSYFPPEQKVSTQPFPKG